MVSNSLSLLLPTSFPSISKSHSPSSSSIPTKFGFFSDSSNRSFRFPKRFRLFRCQIPSFSSASNQLSDDDSPEGFFENNSINSFMRFKEDGPTAELQTAIFSYKKKFPSSTLQPFVQVDLVSTLHIADKEYFEALQKELESYDCTLYEMMVSRDILENRRNPVAFKQLKISRSGGLVASRESLANRRNPVATKKLKSSRSQGLSIMDRILDCIQRQMARVLTLEFQPDCLDYHASNWYHADLDYETFRILQTEKGENLFTFARNRTIGSTKDTDQPTAVPEDLEPWKSKLLWASNVLHMPLVGLVIIERVCADGGSQASKFPEFEALSSLDLGGAMKFCLAKGLTSGFAELDAGVERSSVVIGLRNKVATEALRDALDKGYNRIAILYGGGHMRDLGRRLQEEFDLIPCRVKWITAWSITKRKLAGSSLPFLKALADVSGWPLNRYETLALLIFSLVLAVDLLLWELFLGTAANWISEVALGVYQYIDNVQLM